MGAGFFAHGCWLNDLHTVRNKMSISVDKVIHKIIIRLSSYLSVNQMPYLQSIMPHAMFSITNKMTMGKSLQKSQKY